MPQPLLFQHVGLQIAHHRIDFGQRIRYRRACRKDHPPAMLQRPLRLDVHIECALAVRRWNTGDPRHLCGEIEVFVYVRLVDEQGIDPHFLESDRVRRILLHLGQGLQPRA